MYWWIDELKTGSDSSNHLSEAKDIFNHTILDKKPTYFKLQDKNPIDLMLTNTKKRYDPFLWIGFSCFKVSEPPEGESLFFTIQFQGVSGVQLIDLNRKKDWVDPGATQWFWTQNPWIGNLAPYPLGRCSINRPRSFLKFQNFEIGLSKCHRFVVCALRAFFKNFREKL